MDNNTEHQQTQQTPEEILERLEQSEGQTGVWWRRVRECLQEDGTLEAAMVEASRQFPHAYANLLNEANPKSKK